MKHMRSSLSALFALGVAAGGCESPDIYASLETFEDAARSGIEEDAGETGTVCENPEPSGLYLCALSASVARDKPLYLGVTFSVADGTLTALAQPLEIDILETNEANPNARRPVGDALPDLAVPWDGTGTFSLEWSDVTIVGAANPLTFRDIGGSFILDGAFYSDDVAYGRMSGEVTSPTVVPLGGSRFACQRTDDPPTLDPVYHDDTAAEAVSCN